jgi:hypothetical protein
MGVGYHLFGYGEFVVFHHWIFVVVFGGIAFVLKPKPRWQFTIRDLLVAMTIVAVVLAALASLPKA